MKLIYPAVFEPWNDSSDTGYTVTVPDLKGCVTEGDSLPEAIEMAVDAASGWILGELEDGNKIPKASAINSVSVSGNCFVNLLLLDMDSYAEKYGKASIRKNCTIPAWLNTLAEHQGINFSYVLQEALVAKLNIN